MCDDIVACGKLEVLVIDHGVVPESRKKIVSSCEGPQANSCVLHHARRKAKAGWSPAVRIARILPAGWSGAVWTYFERGTTAFSMNSESGWPTCAACCHEAGAGDACMFFCSI